MSCMLSLHLFTAFNVITVFISFIDFDTFMLNDSLDHESCFFFVLKLTLNYV